MGKGETETGLGIEGEAEDESPRNRDRGGGRASIWGWAAGSLEDETCAQLELPMQKRLVALDSPLVILKSRRGTPSPTCRSHERLQRDFKNA